MFKYSKLFFVAVFLIFMTGCAGKTLKVDLPDIDESSNLSMIDLRPDVEKAAKTKIFSLSISNKAYGIYRQGESIIDPTAIRLFQHRIYEKFSKTAMPSEVKVHRLVAYANLRSELKKGVFAGVFGGLIGASIAASIQNGKVVNGIASVIDPEAFNAIDKEYKRALYTEEENPQKVSVYTVYIDAEIDGKRTFIRTMTPTRLPEGETLNPYIAAIETAIAYYLEQY